MEQEDGKKVTPHALMGDKPTSLMEVVLTRAVLILARSFTTLVVPYTIVRLLAIITVNDIVLGYLDKRCTTMAIRVIIR